MYSSSSDQFVIPARSHTRALHTAHALLKERLRRPAWSAEDFYLAMETYRKAAGIEFDHDDDSTLDKWVGGADSAWRQQVDTKGDSINLAEALEKAIAGGLEAVGVKVGTRTPHRLEAIRGRNSKGVLNEGGAGMR
jgi:hypothetical protein